MTAPDPSTDSDLLGALDEQLDAGTDALAALASLLSRSRARRALLDLQGTVIAGFRLTSILGVGGMGVTYLATDGHDRVAVKLVERLDDEPRDRFRAECRILQGLDHPNVSRYRDHGFTPDAAAWLMMDLVEGLDLQSLLEEIDGDPAARSPVTRALLADVDDPASSPRLRRRFLRLFASVADALHHAHEAGIVHRDVKPANILVRADLEPVLIDFGLSRDLFENVSLTRSAAVLGTLSYMAPEQLLGDNAAVDRRTDVFALGLVLYRALCGRDLRQQTGHVLRPARRAFLLPPDAARTLPAEIQGILYRCLDPRPARRYATAAALASDLRAVLSGDPPVARRPGALRRHLRTRSGTVTAVVALATIIATVTVLLWPPPTCVVRLDALNDRADGRLVVDGVAMPVRVPFNELEVLPGPHVIEYDDKKLFPITKVIDVTEPFSRVLFLTVPLDLPVAHSRHEGPDSAFLVINSGDLSNTVLIDGTQVDPFARWIRLRPGPHDVEVRSPSTGIVERQHVDLPANERTSIHLLSGPLADRPADFRLTLGHVLSPLPRGMTLTLRGSAVRFMNDNADPASGGTRFPEETQPMQRHCMLTAESPDVPGFAELEIAFPEPARSITFFFQAQSKPRGGKVETWYRTDDTEDWKAIILGTPEEYTVSAQIPSPGTWTLTLRARIEVRQPPLSYCTDHFLDSYMDQKRDDVPCFEIIASRQ